MDGDAVEREAGGDEPMEVSDSAHQAQVNKSSSNRNDREVKNGEKQRKEEVVMTIASLLGDQAPEKAAPLTGEAEKVSMSQSQVLPCQADSQSEVNVVDDDDDDFLHEIDSQEDQQPSMAVLQLESPSPSPLSQTYEEMNPEHLLTTEKKKEKGEWVGLGCPPTSLTEEEKMEVSQEMNQKPERDRREFSKIRGKPIQPKEMNRTCSLFTNPTEFKWIVETASSWTCGRKGKNLHVGKEVTRRDPHLTSTKEGGAVGRRGGAESAPVRHQPDHKEDKVEEENESIGEEEEVNTLVVDVVGTCSQCSLSAMVIDMDNIPLSSSDDHVTTGAASSDERMKMGAALSNEQVTTGAASSDEQVATRAASSDKQVTMGAASSDERVTMRAASSNERVTTGAASSDEQVTMGAASSEPVIELQVQQPHSSGCGQEDGSKDVQKSPSKSQRPVQPQLHVKLRLEGDSGIDLGAVAHGHSGQNESKQLLKKKRKSPEMEDKSNDSSKDNTIFIEKSESSLEAKKNKEEKRAEMIPMTKAKKIKLSIDKLKRGNGKKDTTGNITMETPRHSQPPFQAARQSPETFSQECLPSSSHAAAPSTRVSSNLRKSQRLASHSNIPKRSIGHSRSSSPLSGSCTTETSLPEVDPVYHDNPTLERWRQLLEGHWFEVRLQKARQPMTLAEKRSAKRLGLNHLS